MMGRNAITVVAKTDGRGQVRPFGVYNKEQAGAMVTIGNRDYKVTSSGRVNIPKRIMEEFGTKGDDGRNRIEIKFATRRTVDGDHTQKVHTKIFRPEYNNRNFGQGTRPHYLSSEPIDILNSKTERGVEYDDEYSFS